MQILKARSDRPLDDAQIMRAAPSVFAGAPHSSRGERYAFIPTVDVLRGLRREGFEVFEASQSRTRIADKREHTRHMLRLRQAGVVARDGEVPEVIITNSHDGSSAYRVLAGMFRFVCSNGLVLGDTIGDIRVRHSGRIVDDVIEGVFHVVDDLKHAGERIETYKAIELEDREAHALAAAAVTLRWGDSSPVQPSRLLEARRWEDRGSTLWKTYNRCQEALLRGGSRGISATGRRLRTRAISDIGEDLKLNRALATLVDRLADIKMGVAA